MKKKLFFWSVLLCCLFLNTPILRVEAKAPKSYVFTISELKKTANQIAKNIKEYPVIGHSSGCEVLEFNSKDEFANQWNTITEATEIINLCHGCLDAIGTAGPEITISTRDIRKLNYLNCAKLILLPCSTFSTDDFDNVAVAFVTRISGDVIASDGSVSEAGLTNVFSSEMYFKTKRNWYKLNQFGYEKLKNKKYSICEFIGL